MENPRPILGAIRRTAIVVLGFIILFVLIWVIALQGSGDDNNAPAPLGSPVAVLATSG